LVILRDSSDSIICPGYMAINSINESKSHRIAIFYNPDSDITGSEYFGYFDGDYFDENYFLLEYWYSYQGTGIDYTIQSLGNRNIVYTIKGTILGTGSLALSSGKTKFRSIIGQTGSIESDYIDKTSIFFTGVSFQDKDIPSKIDFTLEAIEI